MSVQVNQLIEHDPGPRGSPQVPQAPTSAIADVEPLPLV
jgi:hypothetical protein